MGPSPVQPRGRHASPRTGVLPGLSLPVARARHGRPSRTPGGAVLLTVAAGSVLTVALPGPGGADATAAHAAASTPLVSSAPMPSAAAVTTASSAEAGARLALAERASRSRRVAPAVTATPFRTPAVTPPPKPLLPGCTGAGVTDGYANGRLPSGVLCDVGSDEKLRADAARAYAALAVSYTSRFGTEPCLIDGYRTLGEQQVLRRTKPRFAAAPGTSEHGWGLAVDLGCGVQSRRTVQHAWMQENAPRFGWVNPEWAQAGGSKPEPWHWEFGTR